MTSPLTYAQMNVIANRLQELDVDHWHALEAFRTGVVSKSGIIEWPGTYRFDGNKQKTDEAVRLFGLLGYEVRVDWQLHDLDDSDTHYYIVSEPELP